MTEPTEPTGRSDAEPDAGGVLVAVDGSESADRALAWAVAEATARRTHLTIAHAYHWPSSGLGAMEAVGVLMDALEQDSAEILQEAAAAARAQAPDLPVSTRSVLGSPIPTLVALSADADLVVIGSRGLGGFAGLLLGSVGTGLLANARCPVAVVRGDRDPDAADPVVVGVDSSTLADTVLEEAFRAAQRRGCPLVAVHSWQNPTADLRAARGRPAAGQQETWQRSVADALTERLDRVAARFPTVRLEAVTSSGRPAVALLERAASAQLVVVGTRGRGDLAGMLLGSTSRALAQHSPCPVLVVR